MNNAENMAKMCAEQTNALLYNLRPDVIAYKKEKQRMIENCPMVEFENDMGAIISYCKLNNSLCDAQCIFKINNCACDTNAR